MVSSKAKKAKVRPLQQPSTPPIVTAPIFVIGAARSGTTLLQSMIDAHPDVALVGELHFFDQIMQLRDTIPEPLDARAIRRLRQGIRKCPAIKFVPDIESILDLALPRLAGSPAASYSALFGHLLAAFAERRGVARVGEKTPTNIRYLGELVTFFPDARIIHILRDPRDSISSRVRYPFTSSSVIFNTLLWKIEMIYALDFAADPTTGPDRYMEVRYEAVVADPVGELTRVAQFIGVDFEASMLAGHERTDRVFKDEPWKDGVGRPVNSGSVGAWRKRLTPAQVGLLEYVAGDYLARTGYERQASVGRLDVLVEALRDAMRYVPYKLREAWKGWLTVQSGEAIGGDSSKVNAMLLRALR
jgi:hypothetical protein